MLRQFDYLGVRDGRSLFRAKVAAPQVPIFLGNDIAMLHAPLAVPWRRAGRMEIGACVTASLGYRRLLATLADALVTLSERRPEIRLRLFVICTDAVEGDDGPTADLEGLLRIKFPGPVEVLRYDGRSRDDILASLGSCSALVTCRLHAGIAAWFQGVPTLWISSREKVVEFASRNSVGAQCALDVAEVTVASLTSFLGAALDSAKVGGCAADAGQRSAVRDNVITMLTAAETMLDQRILGLQTPRIH